MAELTESTDLSHDGGIILSQAVLEAEEDGGEGEEISAPASMEENGLNGKIVGGDEEEGEKGGDEEDTEIPVKSEPVELEEESEDGEVFEVESVLQERIRRGVREYLVRWKGYGEDYDTWEPEDNLNCDEIIEEFKKSLINKRKAPTATRGRKRRAVSERPPPPPPEYDEEEEDDDDEEEVMPVKKRRGRKKKVVESGGESETKVIEKKTPGRRGRPPGSGNKSATPRKTRKQREVSPDNDKEPPTIVKCKTRFKKFLIEYAIEAEDDRDLDADQSEDPCVKYFLKCDLDTLDFSVDDVKIEVNEDKKFLTCSFCKRTGPQWGRSPAKTTASYARHLARSILFHVIGQHKGGFHCLKCTDGVLVFHTKNIKDLNAHMAQVHRRSAGRGEGEGEGEFEDDGDMMDEQDKGVEVKEGGGDLTEGMVPVKQQDEKEDDQQVSLSFQVLNE